jgi:hypothetical protein
MRAGCERSGDGWRPVVAQDGQWQDDRPAEARDEQYPAERGISVELRLNRAPRQGAMARFAHQPGVLAFGLDFGLIQVRGLAHFSAGELDLPGTGVVDGRRLEMPVLPESAETPLRGHRNRIQFTFRCVIQRK